MSDGEAKKNEQTDFFVPDAGGQASLLPNVWLHLALGTGNTSASCDVQQQRTIQFKHPVQKTPPALLLVPPRVRLSSFLSAQPQSVAGSIYAELVFHLSWEF